MGYKAFGLEELQEDTDWFIESLAEKELTKNALLFNADFIMMTNSMHYKLLFNPFSFLIEKQFLEIHSAF